MVVAPAVKVGEAGSVKILVVATLLVQPAFVIENPENVPSGKPVKVNAPLDMVTLCGFPAPV